jgi:acetylcholinesterase
MFGGNWALSDVLSALKWVQMHIEKFGGDRENVTLMGYSAGGMIVDLPMSSPRLQGLFHGAMSLSGNCSSPWIWTRKEKQAHNMARLKKIPNEDNEENVRKILTSDEMSRPMPTNIHLDQSNKPCCLERPKHRLY